MNRIGSISGPVTTWSLIKRRVRVVMDLRPPKLFFVVGHVPPLLSDFQRLFLDRGIVGPLGELLGLASLGPVFFGLACRHGGSSEANGNPAGGRAERGFT